MKVSKELAKKILASQETAVLPLLIEMPLPPTTNNLFINIKRGRIISPDYREWKADVLKYLKGVGAVRQYPVAITCIIVDGTGWRSNSDVANREKAAVDALVENHILEGDSCKYVRSVQSVLLEMEDAAEVRFYVHIKPFVQPDDLTELVRTNRIDV